MRERVPRSFQLPGGGSMRPKSVGLSSNLLKTGSVILSSAWVVGSNTPVSGSWCAC